VSRVLLIAVLALGAAAVACGGLGGLPPELPPSVKGADGREYVLLDRGPYKGFYDKQGRLQRIEYDSNHDGKPDYVAHHDGEKSPHLLDIDEDFDGRTDRWEEYDPAGRLVKVGFSRRHAGAPDLWVTPGPGDLPAKKEYDENGDMRVDRREILRGGLIVKVEIDSDNDGQIDRWQDWGTGKLTSELLDTDGDGKPDRKITYSDKGRVLRLERASGE
jgi:hypothetical protein